MGAARPPDSGLTVAALAHEWASAASLTANPPRSRKQVEQLLAPLVDLLVTAADAVPVDEQAAIRVAAELIAHDLIGPGSVGRSIEVLGAGLPRLAQLRHGGRRDAVLRILGALIGGYTQALTQAQQGAEHARQVCEVRFRQIFSAVAIGIAISDLDGKVIIANRAFAAIIAQLPQENVIGAALPELLYAEKDPELGAAYQELISGKVTYFRHEGQRIAADGEVTWTSIAGMLLRDPEGMPTHYAIIAEDISERHLLQKGLSEQALHDMLTGLPNEHYFMSRLHDLLEGADPWTRVTVCRVNLDSFSVINDGIGRGAGQKLLCSVAKRLEDLVIGERAMVARMGADDFAILIENGMERRDLSLFAATINIRLCEPVFLDGKGIAVSAGVGVVQRRAGQTTAEELIRAADATLHRAKRSGAGQWGLDDPQADAREQKHYRLAAEIPGAWENDEITLYYQPVRQLADGRIVALQALLHWDHADGTMVDHATCLALAEQTGLLVHLGRWMVQESCSQQLAVLGRLGSRAPQMRVDLTPRLSQDPDLVGVINGALSATGLSAEQLRVGVPLAALAGGRGDVVDNVGVLAELGTEVVLLGATAGPGDMTHLEDLPVGAVEIDPDIVARIAQRPGDDSPVAQAVRQAIPLIRGAGATVIVPEVDTPEQAQWWRSAGADLGRGAHFGPPTPDSGLPNVICPSHQLPHG